MQATICLFNQLSSLFVNPDVRLKKKVNEGGDIRYPAIRRRKIQYYLHQFTEVYNRQLRDEEREDELTIKDVFLISHLPCVHLRHTDVVSIFI